MTIAIGIAGAFVAAGLGALATYLLKDNKAGKNMAHEIGKAIDEVGNNLNKVYNGTVKPAEKEETSVSDEDVFRGQEELGEELYNEPSENPTEQAEEEKKDGGNSGGGGGGNQNPTPQGGRNNGLKQLIEGSVIAGGIGNAINGEGQNEIPDVTDANLGTEIINPIGEGFTMEMLDKYWAREDEIRKHVEEREDTAYQRAVADMRKAGINPNLTGVSPAASGGGITQATPLDLSGILSEMSIEAEALQNYLDRELNIDQKEKDRLTDLFGKVLQYAMLAAVMKKGK